MNLYKTFNNIVTAPENMQLQPCIYHNYDLNNLGACRDDNSKIKSMNNADEKMTNKIKQNNAHVDDYLNIN